MLAACATHKAGYLRIQTTTTAGSVKQLSQAAQEVSPGKEAYRFDLVGALLAGLEAKPGQAARNATQIAGCGQGTFWGKCVSERA